MDWVFSFLLWPKREALGPWKQGRKKRGSITCHTDWANEANNMFIIWLCWLFRFWKGDGELEVRTATYGPGIDQSQHAKSVSHVINIYIPSNWLSAKREFASTEKSSKFPRHSPPLEPDPQKLKPEAKFFPKIASLVELFYVTGRTFFVGNLRKRSVFPNFRSFLSFFGQNEWHICFFSANFTLISEKWLWSLEYPFNPRSLEGKITTRTLEGRGGHSTFDTMHPIDMKFCTYNKLHLYFQLSDTTWCPIGLHGNDDVTGCRHLGFLKFSDFVQIWSFVLQNDEKTAFSDWNQQDC